MRRSSVTTVFLLLLAAPVLAVPNLVVASSPLADAGLTQAEEPGRGDDLERIKSWRSFLDRADRAFFAGRMNTEAVRAKITEADERIEELEAAAKSSDPDPGGRSDITGDVAFLERTFRAFTAARMNTADAQKWLNEAREKS